MSLPVPTEQEEAVMLASYCQIKGLHFTHIPNETGGDMMAKRRAIRMKRAGVSRGFPDYIIIKDKKLYFIELKRQKGGKVSHEQRKWLEVLATTGAKCAVCNGAKEAIEFLEEASE